MRKIDDSKILTALLTAGTVRGAAAAAGTSESTIRNRLADADFRRRYDAMRSDLLQAAASGLLAKLESATETMTEIMEDELAPDSTRLAACDALFRHCLRYVTAADFERRLRELEAAQEMEASR